MDEIFFWKIIAQLDWTYQERDKIIEPVVIALSKMPVWPQRSLVLVSFVQ
jgi:hypothetical protein